MFKTFRPIVLVIAILFLVSFAGCSGCSKSGSSRVVVFSDVHFNPFYDSTIFTSLLNAEPSEWAGIFSTSTIAEPSSWGSETNYQLLVLTLSSIRDNGISDPVIIFTGDILTHSFSNKFYSLYGSTDPVAMEAFADKTITFFAEQVRSYFGNVPVMFVLGNNDAYEDYKIEPNGAFLSNTAEVLYTDLLNGTADHQTFLDTYKAGGYYFAQPLGPDFMVIALNTVFFSNYAVGDVSSAANDELNWLSSTLASAKASHKKVWILMHVPPGADIYSTKGQVDTNGHITDATTMWKTEYQDSFLQILLNYSDTVTLMLAGHTHMDEYRLPDGVLEEITPAISPMFGNNPAFKIFTFSDDTFEPSDYALWNYDLASNSSQLSDYYTFSTAYLEQGTLNSAMENMYQLLFSDPSKQALYRGYYYSGHDSASPITDVNWPVYWCGINMMEKQNLVDCVNNY